MTNPMFKCNLCKKNYRQSHRDRMGCTDYNARPRQFYRPDSGSGTKVTFDSCIANYSCNEWIEILNFYPSYKNGTMMFSGSYSDQPAKFVSVMNLMENLISEDQQRREKAIKKRGK